MGIVLAASCRTRAYQPDASPEPRVAPRVATLPAEPRAGVAAAQANPFAAEVRDVLVAPCGRCHLSTLGTANLGALGVFDFAVDPWYLGMTTEQLEALAHRVQASDVLDADAKALVGRFVRCEVEGHCG